LKRQEEFVRAEKCNANPVAVPILMRKIANGKNMLVNLVTIKPTNFILGIAVAIWE